jgi:hypothetical protein
MDFIVLNQFNLAAKERKERKEKHPVFLCDLCVPSRPKGSKYSIDIGGADRCGNSKVIGY